MDRADELLTLLRKPVLAERPRGWRGKRPWIYRTVYRGDRSRQWFLTHSSELPDYQPFTREDVDQLLRRGVIEPTYPDDPRARDESYNLTLPTDQS